MAKILIVDDEPSIRKALAISFRGDGYDVMEADSKRTALPLLEGEQPDVVILDLFVPDERGGFEILKASREINNDTPVIIITAHGSTDRAVEAIKTGADDFLEKGFTTDEIRFRIGKLLEQKKLREEHSRLIAEYQRLRREVDERFNFKQFVGNSKGIRDLLTLVSRVVDDPDTTVLIQGESGTGKELIARAIHYNGPRKDHPFVVVNCATMPEHLLESELFGYEKGAFTGAVRNKPGKFEVANGGTIFIDEIGEISQKVQVELLRFTQDHTFERLGGNTPITVNVRIIAATNKRLEEEVANGRFREDLFYRLNVIPLYIPPLRVRKDDIRLLINHILERIDREKGRKLKFSADALAKLEAYDWPGNVRELENVIQRLAVTAVPDNITAKDLPAEFHVDSDGIGYDSSVELSGSLKEVMREYEKHIISRKLEEHQWNISEVARILGERRDTLSRKIKRYGIK